MKISYDLGFIAKIIKKITAYLAQNVCYVSPGWSMGRFMADLRWLDWIFLGGYLPSLSIDYVGMSKDMEKKLPQLYMKLEDNASG